ncbi:MAG: hypothetical protein ACE5G0_16175 [Rhodothermales bacterium]
MMKIRTLTGFVAKCIGTISSDLADIEGADRLILPGSTGTNFSEAYSNRKHPLFSTEGMSSNTQ